MIEWIVDNWWWLLAIVCLWVFVLAIFRISLRRYKYRRRYEYRRSYKYRDIDHCYDAFPSKMPVPDVKKPEWYNILIAEVARLPIGKIMFNPPDTMKLGVKERIETRVSHDPKANLISSLKGRGVPQVEEVKISELMKVRLTGSGFNINPLNEKDQIVAPSGFTEWAWEVIPKKTGKQVLHLHVTLRVRLPFGEEKKDHPVLDREILVNVNPVYSFKVFFCNTLEVDTNCLAVTITCLVMEDFCGGTVIGTICCS